MLAISGMKDNACRERIMEALVPMHGVKDVNVSLIRARAFVVCLPHCTSPELVGAINNAGYSASLVGGDPDPGGGRETSG